MGVSYKKLWKLTIDKGINKTTLRDMSSITNQSLSRLSKDQYVSLEILERICKAMDCDIADVVQFNREEFNESNGKN